MKLAIASGKGGTGKTTLSINLAKYLVDEEQREKVVIADLDVEEPNSGLFISGELVKTEEKFKDIPQWEKALCTQCGLCDGLCNFNALLKLGKTVMVMPELCHSCYACSELCPSSALPMKCERMGVLKVIEDGKLTFIESRLDIGQEQAVPLIAQSIEYLVEKYISGNELIIMDSPPGTSCPVIEVAKNSDFIILVTEPTPFGLHDLGMAVDTMREIGKDFAVVINRWGIGNDDVIKYCEKEGIEIIAKFPHMRKIAELYSDGGLIYKEVPEFREQLAVISEYITAKKRSING